MSSSSASNIIAPYFFDSDTPDHLPIYFSVNLGFLLPLPTQNILDHNNTDQPSFKSCITANITPIAINITAEIDDAVTSFTIIISIPQNVIDPWCQTLPPHILDIAYIVFFLPNPPPGPQKTLWNPLNAQVRRTTYLLRAEQREWGIEGL